MKFLIIVLCVNLVYIYGLTLKQNIMKKITLLAILMVTFITNAQIILSEDFEAGIPITWSNTNAGPDPTEIFTINNTGDAIGMADANQYLYTGLGIAMSGNYAEINSDVNGANGAEDISLISPAMDLSSMSTIKLSFDSFMRGGYGEVITVEVSADGGTTWEVIDTITGTGTTADYAFGTMLYDISSNIAGSTAAHIKLRWTGDFSWGWSFDNIVVQQPEGSAPDVCINMAPADTATDVEILLSTAGSKMIMFSWDAATTGDPATTYDWYFGATADAVTNPVTGLDGTVDGGAGVTYGATVDAGWQPNTTYYWKVASVNVAGSTESAVYSFTTGASDPLGVDGFTIEALSVSPNPVKDVITINSPAGFDSVEVFNQLGQLVLKSSSDLMNNNRLDLSALNPGMYLMQINADNKSKTVKIIKE